MSVLFVVYSIEGWLSVFIFKGRWDIKLFERCESIVICLYRGHRDIVWLKNFRMRRIFFNISVTWFSFWLGHWDIECFKKLND
jgi:hypothetical protein